MTTYANVHFQYLYILVLCRVWQQCVVALSVRGYINSVDLNPTIVHLDHVILWRDDSLR